MSTSSERAQIVEAFARLVEQHCPRGAGFDAIGKEDGRLWGALAEGGWLDVGAKAAGEDALSVKGSGSTNNSRMKIAVGAVPVPESVIVPGLPAAGCAVLNAPERGPEALGGMVT